VWPTYKTEQEDMVIRNWCHKSVIEVVALTSKINSIRLYGNILGLSRPGHYNEVVKVAAK